MSCHHIKCASAVRTSSPPPSHLPYGIAVTPDESLITTKVDAVSESRRQRGDQRTERADIWRRGRRRRAPLRQEACARARRFRDIAPDRTGFGRSSPAESIAAELSNTEINETLRFSPAKVETYVSRVFAKPNLRDHVGAVILLTNCGNRPNEAPLSNASVTDPDIEEASKRSSRIVSFIIRAASADAVASPNNSTMALRGITQRRGHRLARHVVLV